MKYKVGDRVKVKQSGEDGSSLEDYYGLVLEVADVREYGLPYPYICYGCDIAFCDDDFIGKVVDDNKVVV